MRRSGPLPRRETGAAGAFCLPALAALLLCASFALPSQAQQAQTSPKGATAQAVTRANTLTNANETPARAGDLYRIGPGDVLDVRVFNRPQLSREAVRVEGSGAIRMPLIEGEIQAACLTEGELAAEIARRYLKYQRNPQVDVFVKEYNSKPVAVIGAVNTPGRFQLQRQVRLLELLAFAGGPAERAGRNVQIIHSPQALVCADAGKTEGADAPEVSAFKLAETLQGDARSNPYVRPGDIVTIAEAEQVYVVGNVLKPSALALKERVTVSQAIAMAGGLLPDTKKDAVRVVRQVGTEKKEIVVDLKAVAERRAEDVALQPNDIVEVPTSGGKRFLRGLLSGIAPAVARMPVQVIR
ncbi:MAG TPA: polysaccharide biosynthesis/export family protein [Pyrinomonadaceae bacterium]|nr:polysaccharide biosynthesis/export family protein [Pyrinomonadaceae bacterium]